MWAEIRIFGDDGMIELRRPLKFPIGWELAVRTERGEMLKVLEADPTPGDATTNFLTALRSGTPVACSFAAAGVSTAVVEQAFASACAGGSWIDLG